MRGHSSPHTRILDYYTCFRILLHRILAYITRVLMVVVYVGAGARAAAGSILAPPPLARLPAQHQRRHRCHGTRDSRRRHPGRALSVTSYYCIASVLIQVYRRHGGDGVGRVMHVTCQTTSAPRHALLLHLSTSPWLTHPPQHAL